MCAAIIAAAMAWLAVKSDYGGDTTHGAEQASTELRRLNNPRLYEPRCKEPQDREEADLCAQMDMAKAARDLYELTWLQIFLAAVGTVAILASLKLTRDALKVAREANQVARDIGEAQVRAYLTVSSLGFALENNNTVLYYAVTNHGNSPASDIDLSFAIKFGADSAPPTNTAKVILGSLAQGAATDIRKYPTGVQCSDQPEASLILLRATATVEYFDVFRIHRVDELRFVAVVPFGKTATLSPMNTIPKNFHGL